MRVGEVVDVPAGQDLSIVFGGAEIQEAEAASLLKSGGFAWHWTVTAQYESVQNTDFDRFALESAGIHSEGPLEVEIQSGMGPVTTSRRFQVPALGTAQGIVGSSVRALVRRRRPTLNDLRLRLTIAPRPPTHSQALVWVNDSTNPQVVVPLPQFAVFQPTVKAASNVNANLLDPFGNVARQDQVRNLVAIPPIAVAMNAQTSGAIFAVVWEVVS